MQNKQLYLVRHAKAEEYGFHKRDFDRDIITKGRERASRIARDLARILPIDAHTRFMSSTANRAMQTAELFCDILGVSSSAIYPQKSIYEAHYLEILRAINVVPDEVERLIVFGHNPGLSDLTNYLTDSYIDLKTSHVAIMTLEPEISFGMLSAGTARLTQVLT